MHVSRAKSASTGTRLLVMSLLALALVIFWRIDHAYAAASSNALSSADSGMFAVALQEDGDDDGSDDDGSDDDGSDDDGSDDDGSDDDGSDDDGSDDDGSDDDGSDDDGSDDDGSDDGSDDNGSDDDGSDGDDDDDDDIKRYARLESRPDGTLLGTWVIGGVSYTATDSTEFEREYGEFTVGGCVEVEVSTSSPTVAKEIETEEDYKCSGRSGDDDDRAEGELYGVVSQLPDGGRIGTWIIGSRTFSATAQTEFDEEDGLLGIGALVKVEFYTLDSGVNVATEIEFEYDSDYFGDDDDDNDNNDDDRDYGDDLQDDAKVYGLIEARPEGTLIGAWIVGGATYSATERTEFEDEDDYQVGDRVKVEYVIQSNGVRRATEIEETDDDGGATREGHFKLVGFVTAAPSIGFVGDWEVGGTPFVANISSIFKEKAGVFGVGAYVEVEYIIAANQRLIVEIETNVPPGAGDDDRVGKIDSMSAGQGVTLMAVTDEAWTIGGQDYVVTVATQVLDQGAPLSVGAEVYVNSYTNGTGEQVATLVRGVSVTPQAYLPLATR